jgi:hypothetical protein
MLRRRRTLPTLRLLLALALLLGTLAGVAPAQASTQAPSLPNASPTRTPVPPSATSTPALRGSARRPAAPAAAATATPTDPQVLSRNTASAVEIPSLRPRTSRTYLTNQGYQAQISVDSLNYRDPTGAGQPIDDTLVPATTAGFAYQNHANAYSLLLPTSLSTPVTVITGTNTLAVRLVGAQGAVSATGNVGTDANALPGVTVSDAAEPDAVKESLILVGPMTIISPLRPTRTTRPPPTATTAATI